MAVQKKEKTAGYNPYKAVSGISENKGLYGTAKATGGDYMQYHTASAPYYQELYDNGWGELADELTAADYGGSLEILKRFQPTNQFEEYLNTLNAAPPRQNTAGLDPTSSQWQGQAKDFLEASKNPQISDTAQKMYDSYHQLENILNGPITKDENGNVVSGLNVDHYNSGKGQLDYLQNFDVTKQPYYEGIMAQYKLLGGDAAQGELASGAAGNSGNIDSFAQANANRQQLAFTTAGINQALAAANQNQQNWQNVYDRMTAHLNNIGVLNNGKLVEAGKVYETDSVERQNALNQAAGLAQQEMQNNIQWYLDMLGYDKTMDALNKEVAAGLYGVNVDADTQRYLTEMGAAEAEKERQHEATLTEEGYAHEKEMQDDTQAWQSGENDKDRNAATAAGDAKADAETLNSMVKAAVSDSVMDYIYNKNTSFTSLQNIYDAVRQAYPNYDAYALAGLVNSIYEDSIKNVPKDEPPTYENLYAFVNQAYLDVKEGVSETMNTPGDIVSAVVEEYPGVTEEQAKKILEEIIKMYDPDSNFFQYEYTPQYTGGGGGKIETVSK